MPKCIALAGTAGPTVVEYVAPTIEHPSEAIVVCECAIFGVALHRKIENLHHIKQIDGVLGTLLCGRIVAKGSDIELNIGERVIFDPRGRCGTCESCANLHLKGRCKNPVRCNPGAMAEFVKIPAVLSGGIISVPDEMMSEVAAYTEIVACVLAAIEINATDRSSTVLVTGAGPVGIIFCRLLKKLGFDRIQVVTRSASKIQLIQESGAQPVLTNMESIPIFGDALRQHLSGVDLVFETTGRADLLSELTKLVSEGARLALFAGFPTDTVHGVDMNVVHYRRLTLCGVYQYSSDEFMRAFELLRMRDISIDDLFSHRLTFDDVPRISDIFKSSDRMIVTVAPTNSTGSCE